MWWARLLNVISGLLAGGVAASTNAYESISTVTVGAGGVSSISFSSIPSTYKHLQIRWIARNTSNDVDGASENMRIRFNGVTTAKYPFHYLEGNGASASAGAGTADTSFFSARFPMSNATANTFGAGVVDILDYSDANKYKTLRHLGGGDKNGSGYIGLYSGVAINDTTAITSVTMFPQANSFAQYSSFALYGIKG